MQQIVERWFLMEPICTSLPTHYARLVDWYRGDLGREEWLRSLIVGRLDQLEFDRTQRDLQPDPDGQQGFIGLIVDHLPRQKQAAQTETALQQAARTREANKKLKAQRLAEETEGAPPSAQKNQDNPDAPETFTAHVHTHGVLIAAQATAARYKCADADCDWISDWVPYPADVP